MLFCVENDNKSGDHLRTNLKKAFFKLVRRNGMFPRFFRATGSGQIGPIYLSAEKSGRKIWGFPVTKIFPQKMFPQLDLSLRDTECSLTHLSPSRQRLSISGHNQHYSSFLVNRTVINRTRVLLGKVRGSTRTLTKRFQAHDKSAEEA